MKKQISTLENIDIRSIWKNESSDFTPWLAENINRLGDVIDMDLTVIEEEKPVVVGGPAGEGPGQTPGPEPGPRL